jgi:putative tryptophan/tyrosine transport system substrate-binding protein
MYPKRRSVVAAGVGLFASPTVELVHAANAVCRIGVLTLGAPDRQDPVWLTFTAEMSRLGYVENRNLTIETRFARPDGKDLDDLAAELVALQVDVILAVAGTPSVMAAKKATSTIPIVMLSAVEPVRDGLVDSLSRPGGNVTGNSIVGLELLVKRLQLVAEAVGSPARIAYLGSARSRSMPHFDEYLAAMAAAARHYGAQFHPALLRSIDEIDDAFDRMSREHADALVLDNPAIFYVLGARIAALAARHRLPAIGDARRLAEAGLLMTYGVDYRDLARKLAGFVDRILKGAKPSETPVEQATRFDMVVNLKTARMLGLTLPQSTLLRADEVIS